VTFGCFNAFAKIGPETVTVWAQILHRIPESRLMLKCRPLADAQMRGVIAREFAIHNIGPERLDLRGPSAHGDLLAQYGEIDVALDTYPYSGGLTTLEALWMGVPVVTRPGRTFAGRHSFSHLSNVGLGDTIAPDFLDYVARARALAADLDQLAALRSALRPWLAASPVCDANAFARALVDGLVECHQRRTDTKV
ncbi:MAG: glycosyltransferase, partial [Alphaproteobacteria bacterium]|nr:glycosyltransferase [Alphaproteobacteria bacterium]